MVTALIPARGGSKRVPLKNVRPLGGRPLVDWSIETAIKSPSIAKTIVSTEANEIISGSALLSPYKKIFESINVGQLVEVESGILIHKRGNQTAIDGSKTFSIIEEISQVPESIVGDLLLLQPTSPFRSQQEIEDLILLKQESGSLSAVSVRKAESPHPNKTFQMNQKGRPILNKQAVIHLQTPEQELPSFYVPDGAFYLVAKEFLNNERSFVNSDSICFIRSGVKTVNIDTELDLKFAEFLVATNSVRW